MIFQYDNYSIDTNNFHLLKNNVQIPLEPQTIDLIIYLVKNRNRLITRTELIDNIWQGRIVSDTSLSNQIKSARQAFGDDGQRQQVIKTIHGRGYQFIAEIKELTTTKPNKIIPSINYQRRYKLVVMSLILLITFIIVNQFWQQTASSKTDADIRKIAVLPFINTKPNTDTDYLGFAIADQIIGELAYLQNMAVRPSGSIRKYSTQDYDPIIVGNELNVDFILTGNYLSFENKIRLNIELVEIETNTLVWRGKQIEVSYQNAFELQDIVAQRVIEGLKIKFSSHEINRITKDISNNPLAYEYYLRSIAFEHTTQGHQLALKMIKKSIELDDKYAPAYVQLGDRIRRLAQYGLIESEESQDSEKYYLKALSLNPDLVSALAYLAMFYTESNQIDKAMTLTKRLLKINPNSANTHFTLGYIYRYAGMVNAAIHEMEQAVNLNPNNPKFRSLIGTYSGAEMFEKALLMTDNYKQSPFTLGWKGLLNYRLGNNELALKYFDQVVAIDSNGLWRHVVTVHKSYILGDFDTGLQAVAQLQHTNITDGETIYYNAAYYGLLDNKDMCIETLDKAINAGYFNYPFMLNNPYFKSVKNDPEFQKSLSKAKLKHLAFREKYF